MSLQTDQLEQALKSVNWPSHIDSFIKSVANVEAIANCSLRLAIWADELEGADHDNPALSFVREMQISAQYVAVATALALYKPAASAMRCMLESAMYYTYFRTHPSELATLARGEDFFIDKTDLLDFHKVHTPEFAKRQDAFGLLAKLNKWYKRISAIVHGQIPGIWIGHTSIATIKPDSKLEDAITKEFCEGEEVIHFLFLCTVAQELWADFSSPSKKALLRGISGDRKSVLSLDLA